MSQNGESPPQHPGLQRLLQTRGVYLRAGILADHQACQGDVTGEAIDLDIRNPGGTAARLDLLTSARPLRIGESPPGKTIP